MKKIIFLFTLLVFFTGCSVKNINDYEINDVIDKALSSSDNVTNVVLSGYKYYLPRGIKIVDKKANNSKLVSSDGNYYYLYVDIVSYYHKTKLNYSINDSLYFSKKISYNENEGYIEVDKRDDGTFFLTMVYNYSKIETCVKEEFLNTAIYDSIKILSSVSYNDKILNTLIGENILDYQEEVFNLFDSKREDGTFLDYIEEYDVYKDDNEIKDEDVIDSLG